MLRNEAKVEDAARRPKGGGALLEDTGEDEAIADELRGWLRDTRRFVDAGNWRCFDDVIVVRAPGN